MKHRTPTLHGARVGVFYCTFLRTVFILLTISINFAYTIDMTESDLKKEFAINLLKYPNEPFKAALAVFPDDNGLALRMAVEWPVDKEVIAIKKELLETKDACDFLPDKAALARQIWDKMQTPGIYIEDFVKLGKLYADVRGFIEKGQPAGTGMDSIADAFAEISKRLPV